MAGQSTVYGAPPAKNMDSKIDDETAMYLPPRKSNDEKEYKPATTERQMYTPPPTTTQNPEDKARKDAIKSIIG